MGSPNRNGDDPAGEAAVIARGVVKRYGDLVAVDGIDFEVHRGTCLGVLGPNGAGKTTMIEILEGLKEPDTGEVRVLGRTWSESPRDIQERIGVQLQETDFQEKLTVFELLRMFRSFYVDGADLDEVVRTIGLEEKRRARVKTLSGGQKQRLAVGCAILNRPEILFLDEPTTGLDPQARRRLWEVVETFKSEGGTVVLTTHYMEEAERLADDLIIVDRGRVIVRGAPASVIASLGAESVVEFSLAAAAEGALPPETLSGLEGVEDVRCDGAHVRLSVSQTQSVIAALFELLEDRDLVLEDLRTHRPTLEDVFVSLTGKHLRDERLDEIRELTRVRVVLFLREPEAIFWVFVFPMVLAAVLGFAFRAGGIEPSLVAVVTGAGSERLLEAFAADEHLEAELYASRDEAFTKLRKASVDAMVEPGDPPRLTFDPDRAEAATARLRVLQALALEEDEDALPPLELEPVTETGSRYVDFLFPGLLGMNLMGTGLWGIGFAMADVRRRKFLKRLLVTPMRRSSFFLSFIFSRLVFLVLELVILVGFGHWVLGVPFRGDVLSFALVALIGAFTFAGLGILVASRARTIEGVSGLMNLVMMPMWLASGVFFSYERFPDALHPVLRLLPLTGLNDALRAVMLDGESILQQGPEVALMLGWCVVTFALALKIFRWE